MTPSQQLEATLKELSSDFEGMNFDKADFDEEHFNLNITNPQQVQAYLAKLHKTIAAQQGAIRQLNTRRNIPGETAQHLIATSKGEANINVTRNSNNLNVSLPYILFGQAGQSSNFVDVLGAFLPAGITVTQSTDAAGNLVLSYTNGVATDTIIIAFEGLISYSNMLNQTATKYFSTKLVRYTISDPANMQAQLKGNIVFGDLTMLGRKGQNQMFVDSRIDPNQFRKDRADLLFPEQKCKNDFAFVDYFVPLANKIVTWNIFIYERFGYTN
jgi:hypothetical protein